MNLFVKLLISVLLLENFLAVMGLTPGWSLALPCRVCMFLPCLRGFHLHAAVSPNITTCILGECTAQCP